MEYDVQQIDKLLPQQYPFRFVDSVTHYAGGKRMKALFDPSPLYPYLGKGDTVPISVLVEGLAQVAVLFTQLETQPLAAYEVPLLGKIDAHVTGTAEWHNPLTYELSPIRIISKQAVLHGIVRDFRNQPVVSATLCVAISGKGGEG